MVTKKKFRLHNTDAIDLKNFLQEKMKKRYNSGNHFQVYEDVQVHAGMAEAAVYVYEELRKKDLLEKAREKQPEFPLVVTGHSLGAGTAVILAFILRLE